MEDVTEQVIDTEARLSAFRASRDRLRQLLDRASSVQDVVAVERELARVQGEVESLEARLTALRGQVRLSELRTFHTARTDDTFLSSRGLPLLRRMRSTARLSSIAV